MDTDRRILFVMAVGEHAFLEFSLLSGGGWAIHRNGDFLESGDGDTKEEIERGTDRYMKLVHKARAKAEFTPPDPVQRRPGN